jgi:hypothetical protein
MRMDFEEINDNLTEYEKYIDENGLPYCDYKMHRGKDWEISPIEKFQHGINRIIRIVKSYKANTLTDLLKKVQEQVKKDRVEKNKQWKTKAMKIVPQNFEDKMEKMMIENAEKMDTLTEIVKNQHFMIQRLMTCHHFK